MDLNLLKIFKKVAETGSLTKASKLLNHPKSKISRDLVKLEDQLQQTLLNRTPRGVSLTEAGYQLLQSVKEQLEEIENSIHAITNDTQTIKGSIKLTAPEDLASFIVTHLIFKFRDLYPEVNIEIYSATEYLDFQKHNIDLALRIGKLKDSGLIQKKVADIEVGLYASTHYIKAHPHIYQQEDLLENDVALIRDVYSTSLNKELGRTIRPCFSSNSMSMLKQFVTNNKGIATLPSFLCRSEMAKKQFARVLPKEIALNRSLFLLSPPAKYTPKHVKIFKDFLLLELQQELL